MYRLALTRFNKRTGLFYPPESYGTASNPYRDFDAFLMQVVTARSRVGLSGCMCV